MAFDQQAHDTLVQALARSLEQAGSARARIFRTHISSVIVCGQWAYKLKRPVKLPFVDFSSLRLRYLDCMREVQINRRTAPMLYLGVHKITGSLSNPRIDDKSKARAKAIDWAVKMRRFDQNELLSHLITHHHVNASMMGNFAHQHASLMQRLAPLSPQAVAKHRPSQAWLLESLKEIEQHQPRLRSQIRPVRRWAQQQFRRLNTTITQRIEGGHYRDCHGDLHLANLVRINNDVVAFDALEFNEALGQIDPVNDIAFTFMDLIAHDRADLAWAMMNQWCQSSADYRGLKLLRYYTLYRAVVRAKVASLSENATGLERYWGLAKRLVAAAQPSRLVLVGGLSGSGKSTVAHELAQQIGAIVLRADVIRKQRFGHAAKNQQALYSWAITEQTYAELGQLASELVEHGISVVVDATFIDQTHITQFERLAQKRRTPFALIWCDAPAGVLARRIQARARAGRDPSDATLAVLQQQRARLAQTRLVWPKATYQLQTGVSRKQMTAHTHALARTLLAAPAQQP